MLVCKWHMIAAFFNVVQIVSILTRIVKSAIQPLAAVQCYASSRHIDCSKATSMSFTIFE